MSSLKERLDYIEETKLLIREAIKEKGIDCDTSVPFREYKNKIQQIRTDDNFVLVGQIEFPIENFKEYQE